MVFWFHIEFNLFLRQKKKKIPLSTGEEVEMNLDDTE